MVTALRFSAVRETWRKDYWFGFQNGKPASNLWQRKNRLPR